VATGVFNINRRRMRISPHIRELVATVSISHKEFIQPLFVDQALSQPSILESLPGVQIDTRESVMQQIENDLKAGSSKFLIFPVPSQKTEKDFDFSFANNLVNSVKENFGDAVWLVADVCLCSYTTHGHCGVLNAQKTAVLNHASVEILSEYALQLANAGVDCVAPSDMMDGRIGAIRNKLVNAGKEGVSIMSYSAKFSSQWYGPFRDACHSAPNGNGLKDRKSYQISPSNPEDAIESSLRDADEGADILMVKPAGLYTDIIARLKQLVTQPVAAYHVSGEYAAIELLAEKGLLHREAAHLEAWTALKRSGADMIISYAARRAKSWLNEWQL
jgi:porphobilinogen synthase